MNAGVPIAMVGLNDQQLSLGQRHSQPQRWASQPGWVPQALDRILIKGSLVRNFRRLESSVKR